MKNKRVFEVVRMLEDITVELYDALDEISNAHGTAVQKVTRLLDEIAEVQCEINK